jgi:ankyrin repeat protein
MAVQRMRIKLGTQTLDTEVDRDRITIKRLLRAMPVEDARRTFTNARLQARREGEDPYSQPGANEIDNFIDSLKTAGEALRDTTGRGGTTSTSTSGSSSRRTRLDVDEKSSNRSARDATSRLKSAAEKTPPSTRAAPRSRATPEVSSRSTSGRVTTPSTTGSDDRRAWRDDKDDTPSYSSARAATGTSALLGATAGASSRARQDDDETTSESSTTVQSPELPQDVNALTDGLAQLHYAASQNQLSHITKLLASGAEVDIKATSSAFNGKTPLHIAVANNKDAAAALLVSYGADPLISDAGGLTAWVGAVKHLSTNDTSFILPMLDSPKLEWASEDAKLRLCDLVATGNVVVIGELLKKKLFRVSQVLDTKQRRTALHIAAASGYPDAVTLLLERGAPPNAKDFEDKYPIALANSNALRPILKGPTEAATLMPLETSASGGAPLAFEEMIHVQEPTHRGLLSGLAAEAYQSALLQPLMDAMVAVKQSEAFKIIGTSDRSVRNATVLPPGSPPGSIEGWTPEENRLYFSAARGIRTRYGKSGARYCTKPHTP